MTDATKIHVYATRGEKGVVEKFIIAANKMAGEGGQNQVVIGSDLRYHGDLIVSVPDVDGYMHELSNLAKGIGFVSDPRADIVRVQIIDGPRAQEVHKL